MLPIVGTGYIDSVMVTKRKRTTGKPPSATASGRVAILLEQIQEQNRATIEAVTSLGTSLRREISELRRDLTLRIEALEIAVRMNSEDIRKNSEDIRKNSEDIRKNSEDIRNLQEQLAELTDVVRGKVDRADLEALALRVAQLEARVGI